MNKFKVQSSKFKVRLLLCVLCVSVVQLLAQTTATPKLTAKTVKFFVTALGATCAQGELGFDTTGKLQICDPANSWRSVTNTNSFAVGTAGTDVNWSVSGTTVTLNVPDASGTARGAVTTGAQSFAGVKDFLGNVSFDGTWINLPFAAADPAGVASRYYFNTANNKPRWYTGTAWQETATVSAAQTFTGLQTFTNGVDASGASAGVRHRAYNQCARPTLNTNEPVFWFRAVTPTCTGIGNGTGGWLFFDGGNYWWLHGASGGGTVLAHICNGTSCDS